MADLKDSLSQKERRSRTVAFVVGVVIILVLIFLIVQVNNGDNSATEDQNGDTATEQVEEGADTGATAEEEAAGDETEGTDTTSSDGAATSEDGAGVEQGAGAGDTNSAENTSDAATADELPATGPEDVAAGAVVIALAAVGYIESRRQLKAFARN